MTPHSHSPRPYPSHKVSVALLASLFVAATMALILLLCVDDRLILKQLIEDSGPVQMVGQTSIFLAFCISLYYAFADKIRRSSYLPLSYLLLFYTLREADYHYKVSDYAKVSQIKRFYLHDMIPLSTKLLMATILLLFLVVFYRYVMREKDGFLLAFKQKLPWAIFVFAWFCVAFLSQAIDQIPLFHNVAGQVFEEVFESTAEILVLIALVLFRIQLRGDARAGKRSPAAESMA